MYSASVTSQWRQLQHPYLLRDHCQHRKLPAAFHGPRIQWLLYCRREEVCGIVSFLCVRSLMINMYVMSLLFSVKWFTWTTSHLYAVGQACMSVFTNSSRRSQHSQECKDTRRQCFCDWHWHLTFLTPKYTVF